MLNNEFYIVKVLILIEYYQKLKIRQRWRSFNTGLQRKFSLTNHLTKVPLKHNYLDKNL